MYHGVINVYKEPGFTSHDVVAKLRGILRQKKIGHTGTLDPAAEGVLPVCLGQATRLCDLLTDKDKTYQAVLLLGRETDTQDTTGRITAEYPVKVSEEEIRKAAAAFQGDYMQLPPMYSALKVDGKKLYDLARQGKEVERQPRKVRILEISVDWVELPRVGLTVTCSKGTYIRTLCYDLGQALGCGGCMEHLKRTRVERFKAEDSLTLSQIEALRDEDRIPEILIPVEAMFDGPKAYAGEAADHLVRNGNPVRTEDFSRILFAGQDGAEKAICGAAVGKAASAGPASPANAMEEILPKDGLLRVYTKDGGFLGVYEFDAKRDWWKPKKMFPGVTE